MVRNKRVLALILVVILLAAALGIYTILHHNQEQKRSQAETSKPPAQEQLTAGGQPVPKQWQAKAKSLGYYCPSWNAQPGQISSDICLPLDKK